MKTIFIFSIFMVFGIACSNNTGEKAVSEKDSIEKAELKQVDEMLQNQDSILKLKEKELLEKYSD